jgi:hypothetical protein
LRQLAAARMAAEKPGHTLDGTALVNNDMFEFKDRDGQVLWSLAIGAPVREPCSNFR